MRLRLIFLLCGALFAIETNFARNHNEQHGGQRLNKEGNSQSLMVHSQIGSQQKGSYQESSQSAGGHHGGGQSAVGHQGGSQSVGGHQGGGHQGSGQSAVGHQGGSQSVGGHHGGSHQEGGHGGSGSHGNGHHGSGEGEEGHHGGGHQEGGQSVGGHQGGGHLGGGQSVGGHQGGGHLGGGQLVGGHHEGGHQEGGHGGSGSHGNGHHGSGEGEEGHHGGGHQGGGHGGSRPHGNGHHGSGEGEEGHHGGGHQGGGQSAGGHHEGGHQEGGHGGSRPHGNGHHGSGEGEEGHHEGGHQGGGQSAGGHHGGSHQGGGHGGSRPHGNGHHGSGEGEEGHHGGGHQGGGQSAGEHHGGGHQGGGHGGRGHHIHNNGPRDFRPFGKGCRPMRNSSYCDASGDPHYRTFDGKKYNFMGICTYDFTYTCGNYQKAGLKKFLVRQSNERRSGWPRQSAAKSIELVYDENEFKIDKGRVRVNGNPIHPPYKLTTKSGSLIKINQACGYTRIVTDFGLLVKYDRKMHIVVEMDKKYMGYVCGLCGNFNGNKRDDLITREGVSTKNENLVGNSFRSVNVKGNKKCPMINKPDPEPCANNGAIESVKSKCNILKTHPKFAKGHALVDPDETIEDCIYDQCVNPKDPILSCNIFERYAKECKDKDENVDIDWIGASGCGHNCPQNEEYNHAASACENTCQNPNAADECEGETQGSCVCKPGFMRSGLECVPKEKCGCESKDGVYHQIGESWLSNDCKTKFTCNAGGAIQSSSFNCPANAVCKSKNPTSQTEYICDIPNAIKPGTCQKPDNFETCQATGDPHYKTFDKKAYDFQGKCTYDFAYPCGDYEKNGLQFFMIRTSLEAYPGWVGVTAVHTVTLTLKQKTFAISRTQILVDGAEIHPPYSYKFDDEGDVTITKACGFVQISASFGLLIRYDMKMQLYVDLSRYYEKQMCGLCGNFNGNANDDFTDKSGNLATNVINFANSYQSVGVVETKKCTIVSTEPPSSCGTSKDKAQIEQRCKLLLTDPAFQLCHNKVNPQVYYDECVYDQCRDISNPKMSCKVFQAYAWECKKIANLKIKWHTISQCIPDCGENEKYIEEHPVCENTCGNPFAKDFCTGEMTDGCFCKTGYVRSGVNCVPTSNCGCTDENGRYHTVGSSWLSNSCKTKNTCSAPDKVDVVNSNGCKYDEVCQKVDKSQWHCVKPVVVTPTGCKDNNGNTRPIGSIWSSSDCKTRYTCESSGTISSELTGVCRGQCVSKPSTSGPDYQCQIAPPKPTSCTDNNGNTRPVGSIWSSSDCKTRYTCGSSGTISSELTGVCRGQCVSKPSTSGPDYQCQTVIKPPVEPITSCKLSGGLTRPLGSTWRSPCCKFIFKCNCDATVTKSSIQGCDIGSTCTRFTLPDGDSYYCSYDTDVCPLILD